jgi:hypothetical protein
MRGRASQEIGKLVLCQHSGLRSEQPTGESRVRTGPFASARVTVSDGQLANGTADVQQPLLQENHVGSPPTKADRGQVKNAVTSALSGPFSP